MLTTRYAYSLTPMLWLSKLDIFIGLLSQGTTVELKENKSDSYGELRDRANIGIMPISVESSNQLEVQQTPAISEVK